MAYTADDWPIAAALLQFPPITEDPDAWPAVFAEVAEAGFDRVTWIKINSGFSVR